jgi:hypothetical protein
VRTPPHLSRRSTFGIPARNGCHSSPVDTIDRVGSAVRKASFGDLSA